MTDRDTGDYEGLSPEEALDSDEVGLEDEPLDPPDRWSGATRYGTTPFEESTGEPLDLQLRAEQPDVLRADSDEELPEELRDQYDGSVHHVIDTDQQP
jgi:hypothetical protein